VLFRSYYLSYKTVGHLNEVLVRDYKPFGDIKEGGQLDGDFSSMLRILADATEYDELPVRHNEDISNRDLEMVIPVKIAVRTDRRLYGGKLRFDSYDNPHVKAFILLQCHLTRNIKFKSSDYITDTTSVLDQSIRILQAAIDIAASQGYLTATLGVISVLQCIKQALWARDSELLSLPHISAPTAENLAMHKPAIVKIKDAIKLGAKKLPSALVAAGLSSTQAKDILDVVSQLPLVSTVKMEIYSVVDDEATISSDNKFSSNQLCLLKIDLSRRSLIKSVPISGDDKYRVYSPRFPKAQFEGWWVILGNSSNDELSVLKRCTIGGHGGNTICKLEFLTPEEPGVYEYDLRILSDGYVGLDSVVKVKFTVR